MESIFLLYYPDEILEINQNKSVFAFFALHVENNIKKLIKVGKVSKGG